MTTQTNTTIQHYINKTIHKANNTTKQQYNITTISGNTSTQQYTKTTTQPNYNIILQQYNNTSTRQYTKTTTQQNGNITLQQ
jgi:hypothetical protein